MKVQTVSQANVAMQIFRDSAIATALFLLLIILL
jgi:hypothetical protein